MEKPAKAAYNFDEIMEHLEAPENTKKSFELRYKNDDSDEQEIYIVQDEDDLFITPPAME